MIFTSDLVHILPDYPKRSPSDSRIALLAFYVQHPSGFSDSAINKDVLKSIIVSHRSSIQRSVGGTIFRVEPLFSTAETTQETDEEPKSKHALIVGASVGGGILIVILIGIVLHCKGRKR